MNCKLFTAALWSAAAGLLCAETVTFENEPGGMLQIHTSQNEYRETFLLEGTDGENFRFTAEFQPFNLNPTAQHTGFLLIGEKRKLHLLTSGKSFNYVPARGGEEKIGDLTPPLSGTLQEKWNKLELSNRNGFWELNCNGKFLGSFTHDIGALQEIKLYGYKGDIAVRSAAVEVLKDDAPETAPDAPPSVALSFDGNFDGAGTPPLRSGAVRFVPGIKGQALQIDTPAQAPAGVTFPVKFAPSRGSISFWFRPDWEGEVRDSMPWYHLLTGHGENGKRELGIFWWNWLRADFPRRGELDAISMNRRVRPLNHPGDWMHLTFVYDNSGWSTIYVNGLPYKTGSTWMPEKPERIGNFDFSKIRELTIGSTPEINGLLRSADGAIDEFKIYPRPLTQAEVSREYHAVFPFDFLLDKTAFLTDETVDLKLAVAPADFFSFPKPAGYDPARPLAPREVTLRLVDPAENRTVRETTFTPAAVNTVQSFTLPAGRIPRNTYLLQVEVANPAGVPARRSFPVTVWEPNAPRPASETDSLKIGKLLYQREFTTVKGENLYEDAPAEVRRSDAGGYLEAGPGKGNRFAFEIPIKTAQRKGNPVLLEIEWPDDKPRSMAFYLYAKSKEPQHRDRLEGGVQSGDEFPLSGTMQRSRYLFYPGLSSYLFEARTMIDRYPAAVARVSVYELPEGLPPLKTRSPEGYLPRSLGHVDEDQTADFTFHFDNESRIQSPFRTARVLEEITDYMNYTGQNMLSYSLLRYDFAFLSQNNYFGNGLFPYRPGEIPLLIHMLNRRGIDFVASVNISNLADFNLQPENWKRLRDSGMLLTSWRDAADGPEADAAASQAAVAAKPNFFHPETRRLMLDHIRAIVERYGTQPGFRGIDLWGGFTLHPEHGFDDHTAGIFTRQQNLQLPATQAERAALFNAPEHRAAWLRFRADGVGAFLREVCAVVKAGNPALTVAFSLSGEPLRGSNTREDGDALDFKRAYYEELGVDLDLLGTIPDLKIGAMRYWNDYRWFKHWGKPESTVAEQLYDGEKMRIFAPAGWMNCYSQYFETFNNSLLPEKYNAYFQNADVKPHGRYFLRELTFNVASADATRLLIGAQPFGSWGRDEETREFARAYTALPAEPFTTAEGAADPVTVRYFHGKNGTWIYAASLLWDAGSVTVALPGGTELLDLSTGETLTVPASGLWEIPLQAYQLRSFFVKGKCVPSVESATVSERQRDFTAERIQSLRRALEFLRKSGTPHPGAEAKLAAAERAAAQNRYAEAHRLLFSKMLNAVMQQLPLAENGSLARQREMIASSRFAVNCGSGAFEYYTDRNGTLFFPDHPWDGVYGSVSDGSQIGRSTAGITGTEDPTLFATEAYNLDAYRFRVADGRYTVRLYFKIGYEPNAKPGMNIFSVEANGKSLLKDFDLFQEAGNFNRALMRTFSGVEVKNNLLELRFTVPPGVHPSVRFLNAIEVIPE